MKLLKIIFTGILFLLFVSCLTKDDQLVKIKTISINKIESYIENIDNSYWSKNINNQSLYYCFKIYFNEDDIKKDDIEYCKVYNKFNTFWTIKFEEEFNESEKYFRDSHLYDDILSNNGSILGINDLKFEIKLKNGYKTNYNYKFGILDDKTDVIQFAYNEDYNGIKDEAYKQVVKRAVIKNADKSENEININFSIKDNKALNGYIWFYDKNLKYIGMTKNDFINLFSLENAKYINNGTKFYNDGKDNLLVINSDDIKFNSKYTFNDIKSCFIVLFDGEKSNQKIIWVYRSISKRIMF